MKDELFSETLKVSFCNRLRFLRINRGISAREMSLALGQNVNYVNLIENGKRLPSMEGFFFICEYFGLTPANFFSEEQNQTETINDTKQENILAVLTRLDSRQLHLLLDFLQSLIP